MGLSTSRLATAESVRDTRQASGGNQSLEDSRGWEDSRNSVILANGDTLNRSNFCTICLDVLAYGTSDKGSRYHTSLLSLETSARNGCHLCSLVRHFLPERPKHQLDELFTLSLFLDQYGGFGSSILAGWRHRTSSFNLMPLGSLAQSVRNYHDKVQSGPENTVEICKKFATGMLAHCIDHHPKCRDVQEALWSPTRLIKIDQTANALRLSLVTHDICDSYVALSHCWGSTQFVKLLSENLEEMKKSIELSRLPQTFQDAIKITTWMNVQYIWIDSCCIIQDSVEDWLEESANMDQVYRNAYFTIAADCAVDSNAGCIVEQNALIVRPCRMQTELGSMICLPPEALLQQKFESEPLEQRAWALQERILSPRVLHCTSDQLFWECNESFNCQTYPHDLRTNGDFQKVPRMTKAFDRATVYDQWNGVIEDYCKRSLTKAGDKLIALSGIAKAFQSLIVGDTYLAGLWYESLPQALLWRVIDPASVTRPSFYRAPSWSWASIDGKILPHHNETALEICQLCLDILSCDVDLVSDDSTGQVKGGSLQVRGLMKRATWCSSSQALILLEELRLIDGERERNPLSSSEFLFLPDTNKTPSGLDSTEIYCLLAQSMRSAIEGIVIAGTDEPGHYQRLGIFRASGNKACASVKYNLRPSRSSESKRPCELYGPENDWTTRPMDIPNHQHRSTFRKTRDLEGHSPKSKMSLSDSTYLPYRDRNHSTEQGNRPWVFANNSIQPPWALRQRPWLKDTTKLTPSGIASREKLLTPSSNQLSMPTPSLRKSRTKRIHAMYQDKMTDPLSVYFLDTISTDQHLQRLEPRTITLV